MLILIRRARREWVEAEERRGEGKGREEEFLSFPPTSSWGFVSAK